MCDETLTAICILTTIYLKTLEVMGAFVCLPPGNKYRQHKYKNIKTDV